MAIEWVRCKLRMNKREEYQTIRCLTANRIVNRGRADIAQSKYSMPQAHVRLNTVSK
jgi:hypothetical protein